jgi:acyl-CoA thioesterase 11/acyl-coenzyme A thioesterase 9
MQNEAEASVMEEALSRRVEDSADFLADIVGEGSFAGQRVQAGPVLKMMYDTAVSVALRHSGYRSVLLGVDRLDLPQRICHMDLVKLEGQIISVGRSSMAIEVKCFVKPAGERDFAPSHVGFVTMVAVDEEGNPIRDIPRLSYDSPFGVRAKALDEHRRAQIAERRQAVEWIDEKDDFRVSDVLESEQTARYDYLRPEDTVVRVKGQIISQGIHQDGRVKGGDLLVWLDRVATYTARQFTRNDHVITLSINDILFKRPLHATDRIELISRIIHVRTHTLEVSVDIIVHTLEGEQYSLDSVTFLILNYHPSGPKKRITTGLSLSDDDQDSLKRYIKARTRYSFWKSNPESYLTQSPV